MKSIRAKILILVITCILIVASMVSIFVMQRTASVYTEELEKKLVVETTNNAVKICNQFSDIESTSSILLLLVENLLDEEKFDNEIYLDGFIEEIKPSVKEIAHQLSISKSAYIFLYSDNISRNVWYADLHGDGEIFLQPEADSSLYSNKTSSMDWFNVPSKTLKPYWSNPYDGNMDFSVDVAFVSHTRPIIKDGEFYGVVGSDYYYDQLIEYINNSTFYKNGYAFLMSQDGTLLTYTEDDVKDLLDDTSRIEITSNTSGLLSLEDAYISYHKLSNGWIYGVFNYKDDVFFWYKELKSLLVIVTFFLSAVVVLMAQRVSGIIIDPIERLTMSVANIGDGDYSKSLDRNLLTLNNEIGKLAKSIEKLRLIQKSSLDKLNEQNDTMEQEVVERTEDLINLKQKLEVSLEENKHKKNSLVDLNIQMELAINDMRSTQLNLIESEKAASLSLIVTRMAHDFNTPIGSFLTLITYMRKESDNLYKKLINDNLTKKDMIHYFDKSDNSKVLIEENLDNIRKLVERFSSLDFYTQNTINTSINVKDHIGFLIKNSDYYKWLDVVLNCPSDLVITTDVAKFSSIIMNLVENAYLHAYDGENTRLVIGVKHNDEMEISITDFGKGIAQERLKDIFVPYYSETLSNKGSGLGLNVVYNIVTKHFHGKITCTSELNEGTRFDMFIKP